MSRRSTSQAISRLTSHELKRSSSHSSSIFLAELIPQVLIFAVAGCICVQLFVHAHLLTEQAETEDRSMTQIASALETASAASSPDELISCFEALHPECKASDNGVLIFYDNDFSEVASSEAVYTMDVEFSLSGAMLTTTCCVTDGDGSEICRLSADHYFQEVNP